MINSLIAAVLLAASPAATQSWVRNYVATNLPAGGGVSAEWVADYVRTAVVARVQTDRSQSTDYSTNTVDGIINLMRMSRLSALCSATNECVVIAYGSATTNLDGVVLAPVDGGWTNAPHGLWMTRNGGDRRLFYGGTEYANTNSTRRYVRLYRMNGGDYDRSDAFAAVESRTTAARIGEAKGE